MLTKNYIIGILCFLVLTGVPVGFASSSEGKETEQTKGAAQTGVSAPEKKYKLIEKTKDYLTSPKQTFLYYCSPCHGTEANGKGIYFTIDLKPSPADLTNIEHMAALTDDYLLNFITKGSAAMEKSKLCPPWGETLDGEMIKGIIGYLRNLTIAKSKEGDEASDKKESGVAKVVEEKERGTPQALIWSVLAFLCAFFAVGARKEWKKLAEEEASGKR